MTGHSWFVDKSLGEINWGDCQLGGKTILKSPRDGAQGEQSACEHLGDIHTEKIPGTGGAAGTEFTWTEQSLKELKQLVCLEWREQGSALGLRGRAGHLGSHDTGLGFFFQM